MTGPSAEQARNKALREMLERGHPVTLGEAFDAGYAAAEREVVRLRKALGKYGDHETYCRVKGGGDRCTCGYYEAALEPHDGS